jgi:hypothetical protein
MLLALYHILQRGAKTIELGTLIEQTPGVRQLLEKVRHRADKGGAGGGRLEERTQVCRREVPPGGPGNPCVRPSRSPSQSERQSDSDEHSYHPDQRSLDPNPNNDHPGAQWIDRRRRVNGMDVSRCCSTGCVPTSACTLRRSKGVPCVRRWRSRAATKSCGVMRGMPLLLGSRKGRKLCQRNFPPTAPSPKPRRKSAL